jgi:hypothetical protein
MIYFFEIIPIILMEMFIHDLNHHIYDLYLYLLSKQFILHLMLEFICL